VDRTVGYVCLHVPELAGIEVVLDDRYELGDEPGLAIDVYSRRLYDRLSGGERNLIRWMVREFPPEILQSIIMDYHRGRPSAPRAPGPQKSPPGVRHAIR